MSEYYFSFTDSDINDYFQANLAIKQLIIYDMAYGGYKKYHNPFYKKPMEVIMPNIERVIFNGPATVVFWGGWVKNCSKNSAWGYV